MRLTIVKKHHQKLLLEVASSLKSNDPKDALEHILNCWIHPCTPVTQTPTISSDPVAAEIDEIDIIASWD